MDIRKLIGSRILVKENRQYNPGVEELRVLEVSPSGGWVKVMNLHGKKHWRPVTSIAMLEVLIELTASREPHPEESNALS